MENLGQILGGSAVVVSLLFVAYELRRTNDIAVVQSQHDLVSLNVEMKSWLTDPEIVELLMTDRSELSANEQLVFDAMVGSWFDLYEAAFIARERNILTDTQFRIWNNGMCTLPAHWFQAFDETINQNNYVPALVRATKEC